LVCTQGGNGMLGPPVSAELSKPDSGVVMTVTDINPPPDSAPTLQLPHKSEILSITDAEGVAALAEESDAIVNCAVMRPDRRLAFSVNVQGTYNAISAAAGAGHRRFINTGARSAT
jgi:nucleoside-diphosphate-sugar epimerase